MNTVNYSRQHLLDFKSHFPLSRSLSLSLKDLRPARSCCVSASTIVKHNSGCMPVISGTRMIYKTHSLHKFTYYGHVNKGNISYTKAASVLSANSRPFDSMSSTELHRHTKYRRPRGGRLVKLLESLGRNISLPLFCTADYQQNLEICIVVQTSKT